MIYGFNKTSEAGIDVFAPTIFLAGCNLKCPYCMNAKLVKMEGLNKVDIEVVKKYVSEEKCEWLNISGGEPTITDITLLINLLEEIKSWGCKIGISTNGSKPETLRQMISYLNYVALDIKCIRACDCIKIADINYIINTLRSQSIIMDIKNIRDDFDYEIRTTLFPPFIDKESLSEIGVVIRKKDKWVLQQFRHSQNALDDSSKNIQPYTDEEVKELIAIAKKYCNNVRLRYV